MNASPVRRRSGPAAHAARLALTLCLGLAAAPTISLAQDGPTLTMGPPANVFISPAGRPYRAKEDAPYPVVDWFKAADKNGDGKIDRKEFVADSESFFNIIDRNHDGALSPSEIAFYEQRIAPEILGYRVDVSSRGRLAPPARAFLWRTQVHQPAPIDPGGPETEAPSKLQHLDESNTGASPFGFFDEPEPLMAADLRFRGVVFKPDFLKLANVHFDTLDPGNVGYVTLATLPKTPMQRVLERLHRNDRGHHKHP